MSEVLDLESDLSLGKPGALLGLDRGGGGDRGPQPGQVQEGPAGARGD